VKASAATLTGLSLDALALRLGSPARARSVRRWLCAARPVPALLPERIPGVARAHWQELREAVAMPEWTLVERSVARDGTVKYALDLRGALVETVLIPGRGRSTVCVSSQAGCTRSCRFCATATLSFSRNLTAGEIVLQYLLARAEAPASAPARNLVFMGMGEPFDNLDEVLAAVELLTDAAEPRLAATHITVSTSGVLPGIRRFLREGRGQLALSLSATTDAQRTELMPHNARWPIAALIEALREDHAAGSGRRYFIEYVTWDGVNDTASDADRLVALLEGLPAHVNLIPHNAFAGCGLRAPPPEAVRRFQERLIAAGVRCLVREPRGRDIAAACGQLAGRIGAAP
jgi:23S rRNA (adenine2503-C2)-methyltransferase